MNSQLKTPGVYINEDGQYDVKFRRLNDNAKVPTCGTPDSAGYDLYASEETTLDPGDRVTIPLGFATEIDSKIHGRIESRSGMALRGLVVLTGVIDADYRGEWKVIMQNFSQEKVVLAIGERVAQVVFRPTVAVQFQTVEELSETSRQAGGFGSTGKA